MRLSHQRSRGKASAISTQQLRTDISALFDLALPSAKRFCSTLSVSQCLTSLPRVPLSLHPRLLKFDPSGIAKDCLKYLAHPTVGRAQQTAPYAKFDPSGIAKEDLIN